MILFFCSKLDFVRPRSHSLNLYPPCCLPFDVPKSKFIQKSKIQLFFVFLIVWLELNISTSGKLSVIFIFREELRTSSKLRIRFQGKDQISYNRVHIIWTICYGYIWTIWYGSISIIVSDWPVRQNVDDKWSWVRKKWENIIY